MKKRVFPVVTPGVVHFYHRGFLISAEVEVRRFEVIVTLYNGYSIMFATFHFRKSVLLSDPFFTSLIAELWSDPLVTSPYESVLKRCLCRMALRRLSCRSLDILVDSYKSVSEFLSR